MGRLLQALLEETDAANPAKPANPEGQISRLAKLAPPTLSATERMLRAIRASGLPDELLGAEHGEPVGLVALTDRELSTYVNMLAETSAREQGKRPADETARAWCRHCGPVWIAPEVAEVAPVLDGWPRLLGCPGCHVRNRAALARPVVTCAECAHFARDAINPDEGSGHCVAGCDPQRPYPGAERQCARFLPRETKA
jgi:hypothetical protein